MPIGRMDVSFEWDEDKAKANQRKHGINFAEAITVFDDPILWTFPDVEHSEAEDRYISIGTSFRGTVLVVVHLDRNANIRIISCRKATAYERSAYEEQDL